MLAGKTDIDIVLKILQGIGPQIYYSFCSKSGQNQDNWNEITGTRHAANHY